MDRDSIEKLRLDRRLLRRRGWISPSELEKQLSALPDVSEKGEILQSESSPPGDAEPTNAES